MGTQASRLACHGIASVPPIGVNILLWVHQSGAGVPKGRNVYNSLFSLSKLTDEDIGKISNCITVRRWTIGSYTTILEAYPLRWSGEKTNDTKGLIQSKNPDIRNSLAAMQRVAELARKIALQTNTALVMVKDNKIVRIPADQLREQERERAAGYGF